MSHLVILSAIRTPIGSFQGGLASIPAPRLGAAAIKEAVVRAELSPMAVTDVHMGSVLQAAQGQAPARQAAIYAGLPYSVRTVTVHKVCGSGMQAIMQAAHALHAGSGSFYVAGGMESMSQAPYLLPKARDGYRMGHQPVIDSLISDGLWDPYGNLHMGSCAEQCAARYGFTREQQDAFAIESFQRANATQQAGAFSAEIIPMEMTGPKGNVTRLEHDEGPQRVKYEKIPMLKPSFQKDGTITPANASSLSDGAAAIVMTTEEHARARGLKPIARLAAFGTHAQEPVWFTTAPVPAAQQALAAAGWNVGDVDLWEVNEAFSVVPMAFMRDMGVPANRVNVRGGAIALGHPLGASGARIVVTLIAALRERGLRRGLAAICIGGGEGLAVCIELL